MMALVATRFIRPPFDGTFAQASECIAHLTVAANHGDEPGVGSHLHCDINDGRLGDRSKLSEVRGC